MKIPGCDLITFPCEKCGKEYQALTIEIPDDPKHAHWEQAIRRLVDGTRVYKTRNEEFAKINKELQYTIEKGEIYSRNYARNERRGFWQKFVGEIRELCDMEWWFQLIIWPIILLTFAMTSLLTICLAEIAFHQVDKLLSNKGTPGLYAPLQMKPTDL